MNYDEARQTADGTGWHWTTKNDGRIRTAAPCLRYVGSPDASYDSPYRKEDWELCEPHATKEEAERHFYDWCLSEVKEVACSWASCRYPSCDQPANKALGNSPFGMLFSQLPLCDDHRNAESLQLITPFRPGLTLMHS